MTYSREPVSVQRAALAPRRTVAQAAAAIGISERGLYKRMASERRRQGLGIPVLSPSSPPAKILDALQHDWGRHALMALARATEAVVDGDARGAQGMSIAAGIGTDKALVMAGRPTALVMQVHAHRLELGSIAQALSGARAALGPSTHLPTGTVDAPPAFPMP